MQNEHRNQTKLERAYTTIRERIFNGTYVPGYRLVIDALSRELGISPVPIREAIRRLEAEGWVECHPNSSAQVAAVDASKYEEELSVLALLEGYATTLAVPHLTLEDLAHLREVNLRMLGALQSADIRAFTRLNKEFHFFIYERCQNNYLIELLRQVWDRLEVRGHTDFSYIPQRNRVSIEEHHQLLDTIERRAPVDEIEQLVRSHKLHTRQAYLNSPRYQPSPSNAV